MSTKVNIDGYTYTYNPSEEELVLTKYIGSDIDTATPIIETDSLVIFEINPTPADATVILTARGYTQQGNMILVEPNTPITYTVVREGYYSQTGLVTPTVNQKLDIALVPIPYTLTILPHPSNAQVLLAAEGCTQVGNSITAPYGTEVFYRVSKLTYEPQSGSIIITQDESLQVTITRSGAMGMVFNYGSCVVCFSSSTKVLDLGTVTENYDDSLNMGATSEEAEIFMDFGSVTK